MRKYEDVEKQIVTKRECVEIICDMCGRKAEYPQADDLSFEWGGIGFSSGLLEAKYYIEGENYYESLDLCYECAHWLIREIKLRKIKLPKDFDGMML